MQNLLVTALLVFGTSIFFSIARKKSELPRMENLASGFWASTLFIFCGVLLVAGLILFPVIFAIVGLIMAHKWENVSRPVISHGRLSFLYVTYVLEGLAMGLQVRVFVGSL